MKKPAGHQWRPSTAKINNKNKKTKQSPIQWTWVCINSGSWRWTGRPGVLQSMGSQRVRHDWATELNWTETIPLKNVSSSSCFAPQVIPCGVHSSFSLAASLAQDIGRAYILPKSPFPLTSRCSIIKNFSHPNTLNSISHTHTHTDTHTHALIDTTEHTYWHNWASASVPMSSISLTEIHVHWCLLGRWPEPHLLLDTQTPFPVPGTWPLKSQTCEILCYLLNALKEPAICLIHG